MKNVTTVLQLSPSSALPHPVLMKQYVTLYDAAAILTSIFMTRRFIPTSSFLSWGNNIGEGEGEDESKGRNLYWTDLRTFFTFSLDWNLPPVRRTTEECDGKSFYRKIQTYIFSKKKNRTIKSGIIHHLREFFSSHMLDIKYFNIYANLYKYYILNIKRKVKTRYKTMLLKINFIIYYIFFLKFLRIYYIWNLIQTN